MKKKRAGFAALLCTLLIVLDQITKALTVSVLKVHDNKKAVKLTDFQYLL